MPTSSINRSLYANLTPLPSQSSVTRRPQPGTTKEHHQRRRKRTTPHSNHPATFERLGSTRVKLAGRVADYCRDRPDLADVLAIVEPLLSPTEAEAEDEDDTGDPVGFGSGTPTNTSASGNEQLVPCLRPSLALRRGWQRALEMFEEGEPEYRSVDERTS